MVVDSNSAFLFRRIQHAMSWLDTFPKHITASATIANPELHLEKLLGRSIRIVDNTFETSPKIPMLCRQQKTDRISYFYNI